ncbi:MAG TPA: discoidin domain-containing protein, partial [Thermoanaerobaculia bacterium]|nr:discoidin domain-containing protein [Thermoanaerobaculia bacterium]
MKKLALVCLVAMACERTVNAPKQPAPKPAPTIEEDRDADNLLNMAYGASVVSRTGELNLEVSAAHAIDSSWASSWVSSPGVPDETLVYSLLAPSRITNIGITPLEGNEMPRRVAFDGSMDGKQWRELATMDVRNNNERQLAPMQPAIARYIRVRSLERGRYYVRVRAFHALGEEVEQPVPPPFTGCWTINGRPAQLVQQGARITGTIAANPVIEIDGGTDNRVALVSWRQGPMWGHAALTRTPDGAHLTGITFYETFDLSNMGEAWFAERCGAAGG